SGWLRGYGKRVVVKHANGISTRYGHCSVLKVRKGQFVKAGQVIASVGSTGTATGNHLHFEVRKNGRTQNPLPLLKML
ncbi:M23 family metallopeptidase, partial [bacterium]|nr:M23 family metallopeptidase [bacterium]